MRLVQVTVPTGKRATVLELLDDEEIDYVVTDETSEQGYDTLVYFPLPANAVEPVLDGLQQAGLGEESYTVVVEAEAVVSGRFDELQERYATGSVDDEEIARQELVSRADELTPTYAVFLTMTIISSLVATAGLLLDSPAVVVGSMVIAPLIGPALSASIGTVVNDRELFYTAMRYQMSGVAVGIVAAAIFAWLLQVLLVVPPGTEITQIDEIAERIAPELLLLPVALGAGVAGVLSLATGFSVAIVGVMIAAALIPPMAAAGIAAAWGLPVAAVGSTVLVLVNLLGVNLAGLLTLWYLGYRPHELFEVPTVHRRLVKQVAAFAAVVLVLTLFLGGITYASYQVSMFEATATDEAETVLAEYEDLELLSVEAEIREGNDPVSPSLDATAQIDVVVIEVTGPAAAHDPAVADELHERINGHTDDEVTVEVRFVTSEQR